MSSVKRKQKPSSSSDTKNMEAMLRQFGNLLQQSNERMERFEARLTKVERKQEVFNPRRQEKRASTFAEKFLQLKREFDYEIERLKEIVEKENKTRQSKEEKGE